MRPLRVGGETSATYMGERMDAPPTARPPANRASTKRVKVGAKPVASEVTAKRTATMRRMFLRPKESVNRPAIPEPKTQPKSSELKAQPRLKSLSLNCSVRKGPAPVMMAMSKPNSRPPNAAVTPRKITYEVLMLVCMQVTHRGEHAHRTPARRVSGARLSVPLAGLLS